MRIIRSLLLVVVFSFIFLVDAMCNTTAPFDKCQSTIVIDKIYDLSNKTVRLPNGCTIVFNKKGQIKNGTLVGDSTVVVAGRHLVFDNVLLKGDFSAQMAYSEWFNIKDDCILDKNGKLISGTDNLQQFRNLFLFDKVSIKRGVYLLNGSLNCRRNQKIYGNGSTLKFVTKSMCLNIGVSEKIAIDNITIKDMTIIGSKQEFMDKTEWWHGVFIGYATNIIVDGVTCTQCRGDGFYIGTVISKERDERVPFSIKLTNVKSTDNHRNGLSITRAINVEILNSVFCKTSGTLPGVGIDIEPNTALNNQGNLNIGEVERIFIKKCRFYGNMNEGLLIANQFSKTPTMQNIKSIQVSECYFIDDDITISGCLDSKFESSIIDNSIVKINGGSIINNLTLANLKMRESNKGNESTAVELTYYDRRNWPIRSNITISNLTIDGYGGGAIYVGQGHVFSEKIFDGLTVIGCNITNCGKGIIIGKSVNNLFIKDNFVDGKLFNFLCRRQ